MRLKNDNSFKGGERLMRTFNYAMYARTIELGIASPNMTKIAQSLFEPIISHEGVVNHLGNPYNIDSKQAKAWYEQTKGIPANIKTAAGLLEIVNSIGDTSRKKL